MLIFLISGTEPEEEEAGKLTFMPPSKLKANPKPNNNTLISLLCSYHNIHNAILFSV